MNETENESVYEYMLDKLKTCSKIDRLDHCLEQLKNELDGDPRKNLLYNIYASKKCNLNNEERYLLYLALENEENEFTLDQYEIIYCFNECINQYQQLIVTLYYKWYNSSIFKFNSKNNSPAYTYYLNSGFPCFCRVLSQIESQGYQISLGSRADITKSFESNKCLVIIMGAREIIGFIVKDDSRYFRSIPPEGTEYKLQDLAQDIVDHYEMDIEIPEFDYFRSLVNNCPDFLSWHFVSDYRCFRYSGVSCTKCISILIDRLYKGLENLPDCLLAIQQISQHSKAYLSNNTNLKRYLQQFPNLNINKLEDDSINKELYDCSIKIPEMNFDNMRLKSTSKGKDSSWLLHVAHFSYIIYLMEQDTDYSRDLLRQICNFNCDFTNDNEIIDHAIMEYYQNMKNTPEFLEDRRVYNVLFFCEDYSTNLLKIINIILKKYPAEMPISVPKYIKFIGAGFQLFIIDLYDRPRNLIYFMSEKNKFNYRLNDMGELSALLHANFGERNANILLNQIIMRLIGVPGHDYDLQVILPILEKLGFDNKAIFSMFRCTAYQYCNRDGVFYCYEGQPYRNADLFFNVVEKMNPEPRSRWQFPKQSFNSNKKRSRPNFKLNWKLPRPNFKFNRKLPRPNFKFNWKLPRPNFSQDLIFYLLYFPTVFAFIYLCSLQF